MTTLNEKTMNNAREGKQGNFICKFFHYSSEDVVYELRECPINKDVYVIWWDKSIFGVNSDNFNYYYKNDAESYFDRGIWKVVGNKCKRAIFKQSMGDKIIV